MSDEPFVPGRFDHEVHVCGSPSVAGGRLEHPAYGAVGRDLVSLGEYGLEVHVAFFVGPQHATCAMFACLVLHVIETSGIRLPDLDTGAGNLLPGMPFDRRL